MQGNPMYTCTSTCMHPRVVLAQELARREKVECMAATG
jgi:hypothetical protein